MRLNYLKNHKGKLQPTKNYFIFFFYLAIILLQIGLTAKLFSPGGFYKNEYVLQAHFVNNGTLYIKL